MNTRERFTRVMHYQSVDHVVDWEFGYWDEVPQVWKAQGLPSEVADSGRLEEFFGFEGSTGVHIGHGLCPPFPAGVVEETENHVIMRDGNGALLEQKKDGTSSIPHFLEFALKDRSSWQEFKKRLDPTTPEHYLPADRWEAHKARLNAADVPVIIGLGSLFGWLRDWAGFEGISVLCADDPKLIHEMVETLCDLTCALIEKPLAEVKIEAGSYWEDMAFNHGPIISPLMFREFLVPRYKRITELLHRHGVDVVYLDCDGNINDIAGLWLESGVNCMFPVEVAGGTDPVALRQRFGKEMLLMGGVNKRAMAAGPEAIDRELARLAPVVAEGGFIPHCDHRCPPDVSYKNYLYYLKRKREMFGIPHPSGCPLPEDV
jgi:uroporphyrinogen-III decarboxylase